MVPILISFSHQKDPRTGRDRRDDAGGPGTARRRVGATLCAEDEFADLLIRLRGERGIRRSYSPPPPSGASERPEMRAHGQFAYCQSPLAISQLTSSHMVLPSAALGSMLLIVLLNCCAAAPRESSSGAASWGA